MCNNHASALSGRQLSGSAPPTSTNQARLTQTCRAQRNADGFSGEFHSLKQTTRGNDKEREGTTNKVLHTTRTEMESKKKKRKPNSDLKRDV